MNIQNEDDVGVATEKHASSYASIISKKSGCESFLKPVYVASSHIDSIRMESVFVIVGQRLAAAAVYAISEKNVVPDIGNCKLRQQLMKDKQNL